MDTYNIGIRNDNFKYLSLFKLQGKLDKGRFWIFKVINAANAGEIIKAPT